MSLGDIVTETQPGQRSDHRPDSHRKLFGDPVAAYKPRLRRSAQVPMAYLPTAFILPKPNTKDPIFTSTSQAALVEHGHDGPAQYGGERSEEMKHCMITVINSKNFHTGEDHAGGRLGGARSIPWDAAGDRGARDVQASETPLSKLTQTSWRRTQTQDGPDAALNDLSGSEGPWGEGRPLH